MHNEKRCPGCKRESCDGCGIYRKLNTNKQLMVQFPESFRAESGEGLGISFDVGTTTLAGMLWNMRDGALLDAETAANPQAVFGADVVSRIQAAVESREKLNRMQALLVKKLDEMAGIMWRRVQQREEGNSADRSKSSTGEKGSAIGNVTKVTVVGNTAMCEIFMGMKPEGLSQAPFTQDYQGIRKMTGGTLGFQFLKETKIDVLPAIGGYVGADALAVCSYVNYQEQEVYHRGENKILAVDIGTNGEILLWCNGKRYACSTAAGPALEGGAVSQGMRAAAGAIDKVSLNGSFPMQDLVCRVIGGEKSVGICGSGLLDGLAVLYRIGVVDDTGYMRSAGEAEKEGVPRRICRRIEEGGREGKGRRRVLLTNTAQPVYLTADDIRQLQLSISALRSGMEVLMKKAGIQAKELDRIYLAGAFGCYIDIESSIAIGLLPDDCRKKIVQAGNLAGTGAAMALLSTKVLGEMEEKAASLVHVELAAEEDFKELFLSHMNFPLNF